jgi:hypothetical protein
MTSAKGVLQLLKSAADFQLHINCNGIGIGIDIEMKKTLVGSSNSDSNNDHANCNSQEGYVFLAINGAISWQA